MKLVSFVALAVAVTIVVPAGFARAEQKLGVEVYPGATSVPARSDYINAAARGIDASCYKTRDAYGAVVDFVARQPGFTTIADGVLRRGQVDVTIRPAAAGFTVFCIMLAKD